MPQDNQHHSSQVSYRLANARLDALRDKGDAILLEKDSEDRREDVLKKLEIAIENALFLEEERKKMWKSALHTLDEKRAKELLDAILRENLRYKKGIRKLKFKKIPERQSEEASGDF